MVAAHGKNPVGNYDGALRFADCVLQFTVETAYVVVFVNRLAGRARKPDGVDDAVVIQLIADQCGGIGGQCGERAQYGSVRRAENHGRLPTMKFGQAAFQFDVRSVRAADEAHGARTGAEYLGCFFFSIDHLRPQRHAEIGIRIHANEGFVAFTLEDEAWTPATRRRHHAHYYRFLSLARALCFQIADLLPEYAGYFIERHLRFSPKASATCP